jgi:rubrerythrin
MAKYSINELFELSLSAESEAEAFYSVLAERFSANIVASGFFKEMRRDEQAHIKSISSLRDSLPRDRLDEEAPPHAIELISTFLRFSADENLRKVKDLEDAYRLCVNLEFSEVNRLHELLMDIFTPTDESRKTCFRKIKDHLEKLNDFHRATGSADDRRRIVPHGPEL